MISFSGGGRSLVYSTFNKPTQVTKGSSQVIFNYNINRSRYKRINRSNNRLVDTKITAGGVEVVFKGSSTEVRRYVGNALMKYTYNGTRVIPTKSIDYLYKDHLGSMDTIVSASSSSTPMKMSFDSFGNRRLTSWVNSLPTSSGVLDLLAMTDKGYTGHETLDDVGLIHMNGRVYDPTLGRFLSADPNIQAPTDTQSLNRYSYVLNNPLSATDPSGYFFSKLKKYWRQIASLAFTIWAPWGAGLWASIFTGAVSGAIATGSWKGALIGAFSAGVFHGIGTAFKNCESCFEKIGGKLTDTLKTGARVGKTFAHAVAGGVMSVLNGGKFGHGFASAGVTQAFAPSIDGIDSGNLGISAKRVITAAVLGGTTSVISGGKFANGAITAAFSRAFNDDSHISVPKGEYSPISVFFTLEDGSSIYLVLTDGGLVDQSGTVGYGFDSKNGTARRQGDLGRAVSVAPESYFVGLRILKGLADGFLYLVGPRGPLFGHKTLRKTAGFFNKGKRRLGWSKYGGRGKSYYHFEYRNGPHNSSKPWFKLKVKDVK